MPQKFVRTLSMASLLLGLILITVVAVTSAQTGYVNVGTPFIVLLEDEDAERLFEFTPQVAGVRSSLIIGLFDIPTPIGLCEVQIDGLTQYGASEAVLDSLQLPNELVLWRLLPNATEILDEAWVYHPYAYNPISNTMIFSCFDAATYALFRGTNVAAINSGLSDAGVLPTNNNTGLLVLAGVLLLAGGGIGLVTDRKNS